MVPASRKITSVYDENERLDFSPSSKAGADKRMRSSKNGSKVQGLRVQKKKARRGAFSERDHHLRALYGAASSEAVCRKRPVSVADQPHTPLGLNAEMVRYTSWHLPSPKIFPSLHRFGLLTRLHFCLSGSHEFSPDANMALKHGNDGTRDGNRCVGHSLSGFVYSQRGSHSGRARCGAYDDALSGYSTKLHRSCAVCLCPTCYLPRNQSPGTGCIGCRQPARWEMVI